MNELVPSRRVVRFGAFEADLAAGELRKNGLKIRLSGQPFQVLAILLERAGEVVTREELQRKLWPDGTFVDFDRSLNTAINKIREALSDSAENPRFVETLARRGYRFIAPVEITGSAYFLRERDVNRLNSWTLRFSSPVPVYSVILGRLWLRNLSPLCPCRQSGSPLASLLSFQ